MSRIYFHSESDGDAELSGAERAHMGCMVNRIAWSLLNWDRREDSLMQMVEKDSYLYRTPDERFEKTAEIWFSVDGQFRVAGSKVSAFTVALNTATAVGGDALKLAARLHGQCEIHCWVDGPNRAWLASIMEQGLSDGVFRREAGGYPNGWESVIEHLRKRDTEPVVCSYSVCDQFPSGDFAGWKDMRDGDGWYELHASEQWERAMAVLRGHEGMLEIKPDDFREYRFGSCITAMSLRDAAIPAETAAT